MNDSTHAVSVSLTSVRTAAWLRNGSIVLAGTLFVALCARVSLPLSFTPVPLTLQPFAVLLLGILLTPRLAGATLVTYLLEGAAGLPVFAPGVAGVSGLAHLLGPTGGYLLAYPIAAYAIAALWRGSSRSMTWALLSVSAGDAILLGMGALWLGIYTHASLAIVLSQAVVPFLPGDALKVAAAAVLGFQWLRLRRNGGPSHPTV
ncbi:MAG TPA: biotin transporter BioY [Terracidiphilus sp.]|jgi:biotin transport system substrate-specific component